MNCRQEEKCYPPLNARHPPGIVIELNNLNADDSKEGKEVAKIKTQSKENISSHEPSSGGTSIEKLKVLILGFLCEFLGATLFSLSFNVLTDTRPPTEPEILLVLDLLIGALIVISTMMQVQLVLTRGEGTKSVPTRNMCCCCPSYWTMPSFMLWLASFGHVAIQTLATANPRSKVFTPIVCEIEESGVAFVVLIAVLASIAFRLDMMNRLWKWRKDLEIDELSCNANMLLWILLVLECVAIILGVISYVTLWGLGRHDESQIVNRGCIICVYLIEVFILAAYHRETSDWSLNIYVLIMATLSAWGFIFTFTNHHDGSPSLIAPDGLCFVVLIILLGLSVYRSPRKDAAGNSEHTAYSYVSYIILAALSIAAHSVRAVRAKGNEYPQFPGDTATTKFADSIIEAIMIPIIFSITILKMRCGLGSDNYRFSVGQTAAACVTILWFSALLDEISHLHHAYSTCRTEVIVTETGTSSSSDPTENVDAMVETSGNHETPHGSGTLYAELALFGFYSEFCFFSIENLFES
mmetsp:Transcript_33504/g.81288  ORF Transcript_33504/g.81288 Transcript_33504/m.81288 type:complete len:525 (+) Transcript_33504:197-1771(+)|eukprot:CAMPEP_0114489388 /NCGR_PEP_ID=MMETSP0109-20121206/1865_1 /TAXON_ID=29199 /ORGANISM="Chlorarachnion reptans, Strain CCCM449" /LENGTH=524 /DNA_ID=CAMNT_0001665901 /DNA_START=202 /DNA_END=1776 /DNA_ORIENTATION=-